MFDFRIAYGGFAGICMNFLFTQVIERFARKLSKNNFYTIKSYIWILMNM